MEVDNLIDSLNSLHEEMQGIEGTEIEVRIDWEYNVNIEIFNNI